jgi:hypothetical protein
MNAPGSGAQPAARLESREGRSVWDSVVKWLGLNAVQKKSLVTPRGQLLRLRLQTTAVHAGPVSQSHEITEL